MLDLQNMGKKKYIGWLVVIAALLVFGGSFLGGCGVYSFRDVSIPDSVKTIKINPMENRAPYVNAQLAPNLTERIRRKVLNQTRLKVTNEDNANWVVNATITDYSVSTSGVTTNSNTSLNRLTVTVQLSVLNNLNPNAPPQENTVSRSFDFSAQLSLQQAEQQLLDQMLTGITDDIFIRLFSNW
jgi:outer membrane lipopolysaccharide assembly protein LptE/RlpB